MNKCFVAEKVQLPSEFFYIVLKGYFSILKPFLGDISLSIGDYASMKVR